MQEKQKTVLEGKWPDRNLHNEDLQPIPFHAAQNIGWDAKERFVVISAGNQSGKTGWGPHWMEREIYDLRGQGDYIAVTSSFDMFKLKMLPAMLAVFEGIYGVGRYWGGDRVIELSDPYGKFLAKRASDRMWGRIILRSADSLGGLESATAKAIWMDECGQDRFEFGAYKALRRRGGLYGARFLMTTTLYNIGWFTQHVIDPAVASGVTEYMDVGGAEIEVTRSQEKNTIVIQFDSILNPAYPREEYEEAKRLLPDEEFQMQYRGRKGSRRFLIYASFDPDKHTIHPFPVPDTWKRYVGVDFGGSHTAAVFYAEEPGTGRLFAYREYMGGNKSIEEHVKELAKYESAGIPYAVGGARSEDQWRLEFGKAGMPVMPPNTDDVDIGIQRVYALHAMGSVIYFDTLSGILDQKGRYRRKRDREGNATDEIDQKNTFHFLDAERYILGTIRPGAGMRMKIINLGETDEKYSGNG